VATPKKRNVRVSIIEVADKAGVSRSTASRVLGGYGKTSIESREAVLKAAKGLGYRVNTLARAMITGKSFTLGVVLADIENDYFARLVRGAADAAKSLGYEILLINTDEDLSTEKKAIQVLLNMQVDGILIAPASSNNFDHLIAATRHDTPIVLVDRKISNFKADIVAIDNFAASSEIVQKLIDFGHRRISMVTSAIENTNNFEKFEVSTGKDRVAGYIDALKKNQIKPKAEYLRRSSYSIEASYIQTKLVLNLPNPPTAIFASDNIMLLGVLKACRELGIQLPTQLSIVGMDDTDWMEVATPRLTVIRQPVYEIGRLGIERLVLRINGERTRPQEFKLAYTWVERDSITKPVNLRIIKK